MFGVREKDVDIGSAKYAIDEYKVENNLSRFLGFTFCYFNFF